MGKPVLLLFVDYNTGRSTQEVVKALRRVYPDHNKVPIALVVDLRSVPKLLRGTAARVMEAAYKHAATEIPSAEDPADHLILLPDWSGNVFKGYQVGNVNKDLYLILIGANGRIAAVYQGQNPTQAALDWLNSIFKSN
ncbi:MAG: hypothetical protein R6X18_13060 [Chloroflexota bacterium]|jgi:hypothetical protein